MRSCTNHSFLFNSQRWGKHVLLEYKERFPELFAKAANDSGNDADAADNEEQADKKPVKSTPRKRGRAAKAEPKDEDEEMPTPKKAKNGKKVAIVSEEEEEEMEDDGEA